MEKMDCIFENFALINVFPSQFFRSISHGLAVACGWMFVKLGKLLLDLGNGIYNVQY
jgi:hypothetical protein